MVDGEPSRRLPSPEAATAAFSSIGIYNETHRLRSTTTWGPVGAEAVVAQYLPTSESLFLTDMNVAKARAEGIEYARYLRSKGVEVATVRDALASTLPTNHMDLVDLYDGIDEKIKDLQKKFGLDPRFEGRSAREMALDLVDEDVERYGESRAIALNQALVVDADIPIGNAIYARDQMNVLLGTRFVSRMKGAIRVPEVALYESVYNNILASHDVARMPDGETFEGGDAYVHKGIVYVGVGVRTSPGAALSMYEHLRPQLERDNLRFAVVEDPERRETVDFIHLDTFSNPIGPEQILVCSDEANRRLVGFGVTDADGNAAIQYTGDNFIEHLQREGNDVVEVSAEEQSLFGCNFLALDENVIVFPRADNDKTALKLQQAGKVVEVVDLSENTKGNGAAHCMTGQLVRQN